MENESLKTFGLTVKRLREQKGMSQVELANLCEFERGNMTRIEKGNTNPTLITILKIAKALNVKPSDLLEGLDE